MTLEDAYRKGLLEGFEAGCTYVKIEQPHQMPPDVIKAAAMAGADPWELLYNPLMEPVVYIHNMHLHQSGPNGLRELDITVRCLGTTRPEHMGGGDLPHLRYNP